MLLSSELVKAQLCGALNSLLSHAESLPLVPPAEGKTVETGRTGFDARPQGEQGRPTLEVGAMPNAERVPQRGSRDGTFR